MPFYKIALPSETHFINPSMVRDVEKRCSKLSGHFDHLKAESFSREAKLNVRGIVLSSNESVSTDSLVREFPKTLNGISKSERG